MVITIEEEKLNVLREIAKELKMIRRLKAHELNASFEKDGTLVYRAD